MSLKAYSYTAAAVDRPQIIRVDLTLEDRDQGDAQSSEHIAFSVLINTKDDPKYREIPRRAVQRAHTLLGEWLQHAERAESVS